MTVSRVINGQAKVAAATKERVLGAMRSLDYRPNSMARGLASGRSRSIGVLTVDPLLWGPSAALHGIELAARDRGYTVTISHLGEPGEDAIAHGAALLRSRSSDGIILLQPRSGEATTTDLNGNLPMVAIHSSVHGRYPLVSVDQRLGARMATEHLLSLGHRTVWHISGPEVWYESQERVEGWRDTLVHAGALVPALARGDWSARSGYQAAREILENPGVTAIFAANDTMALGALHSLHERGLSCPDDVSLVGFDDIPEAEFFAPGLTTLRQDFDEVGRRSVGLLIDMIENDLVPEEPPLLEPTLIVRGSTAAPAR